MEVEGELLYKPAAQARAICREDEERLPRSTTKRNITTWIKLLTRVDPKAQDGFGFEGDVYRPGDVIARVDLREPAIFLEYVACAGDGEELWILWRYNFTRREFEDLAQVRQRPGSEWAAVLRPLAIRELHPESQSDRIAMFDYEGARDRIWAFRDAELEGAPDGARRRLSAMLLNDLLADVANRHSPAPSRRGMGQAQTADGREKSRLDPEEKSA